MILVAGFAAELTKARIYDAANRFIDAYVGPIPRAVSHLQGLLFHPITVAVLVALGIVVLLAIHAYIETRIQVNSAVKAVSADILKRLDAPAPTPAPPPKEPERVFVDAIPADLGGLFKGLTTMQGRKLADPYLGKWMRVSGAFGDVDYDRVSGGVLANFSEDDPLVSDVDVLMFFSDTPSIERLATFRRGQRMAVVGRIKSIEEASIALDDCELMDAKLEVPRPKREISGARIDKDGKERIFLAAALLDDKKEAALRGELSKTKGRVNFLAPEDDWGSTADMGLLAGVFRDAGWTVVSEETARFRGHFEGRHIGASGAEGSALAEFVQRALKAVSVETERVEDSMVPPGQIQIKIGYTKW